MAGYATTYWSVKIEEMLSLGFSTQHIAKQFNIPHNVLLKALEERRQERNEWQKKIDEKYKNKNI